MPESTDGKWDGVQAAPGSVFAVHAILLNNKKVLLFSGIAEGGGFPLETYEWDPTTAISTTDIANIPVDLFCCHHTVLEDGRVLTVGGAGALTLDALGNVVYADDWGINAICIYDPSKPLAQRWEKIGEMDNIRWYPTAVTMADGSVAVFSGITQVSTHVADAELLRAPFKGPGYSTQTLAGGEKTFPSYPGMLMAKGGRIFHLGTTWDYRGSGTSSPIGTFSFEKTGNTANWKDESASPEIDNREEGTFVLLPPAQDGRILVLGGGFYSSHGHEAGSDLKSAEILNTQSSPVEWTRIDDMNEPRVNPSVVLLPDGKVLVIGGHDSYKWDVNAPSNQADMYDPVLDEWTEWTDVDTMGTLRIYHSTALLLPDGRVLVAGGVIGFGEQQNMEFYRPPYFFNGARPSITSISREDGPDNKISYGGVFFINTPNANDIIKVALMRPGSMTHHTDTEQRYVALESVAISDSLLRVGVVNDPTVAPPGYYMLWITDNQNRPCEEAKFVQLSRRHCRIVTDRSHVSNDEVNESSETLFNNSFYVILDGFVPDELSVDTATPTTEQLNALAPDIRFTVDIGEFSTVIDDIIAVPQKLLLEDDALPDGVKQKFTIKYGLKFNNNSPFFDTGGDPIENRIINITAEKIEYVCKGKLNLTHQPNPFIVDGETHWLSTDLRVFQISATDTRFGRTIGNNSAAAISYIQGVLGDFNTNLATGNAQFEEINTEQATSKLELARSKDGKRVFNFAIAKVSYRGKTLDADHVRLFFRMFTTVATGMDFRVGSTYRRIDNTSAEPIPILGLRGGELVTIPFFAESRVNTALDSMNEQRDLTNRKTIDAVGSGETTAFFGCWLDFNQTALRFPIYPGGIGPYTSGMQSIQNLIRGRHQCLVAEIFYTPDPINEGDTPANNDNLSQRNLAIVLSDNPGNAATHTVQHTFEIKANAAVGIGTPATAAEYFLIREHGEEDPKIRADLFKTEHDELMIQWHNLPRTSRATLYIPDIQARDIQYLTSLKIGPERIQVIDENTLELLISDVSYITLPPAPTSSIPALLTIELPDNVVKRQQFNISIMQIEGQTQKILGTFEFVIPVSTATAILAEEERTLSVFKSIGLSIPTSNHWKSIFDMQIDYLSGKVKGLGGKPELIAPSADGDGRLPDDTTEKLPKRCTIIGVIFSILIGLAIASLALKSIIVTVGISIILLMGYFYWKKHCKISLSFMIKFITLGLMIGLILLAFR